MVVWEHFSMYWFSTFYLSDAFAVDGDASDKLHSDVEQLNAMISVMKNIGDEFVDNILHLDHKSLSQSQQRVYDKVMAIAPHMWSTNMISSRILDQSHLHYWKNKDAPLIRILKKEKVVLQSRLSIMAHIESHERKVKRIEKGVA